MARYVVVVCVVLFMLSLGSAQDCTTDSINDLLQRIAGGEDDACDEARMTSKICDLTASEQRKISTYMSSSCMFDDISPTKFKQCATNAFSRIKFYSGDIISQEMQDRLVSRVSACSAIGGAQKKAKQEMLDCIAEADRDHEAIMACATPSESESDYMSMEEVREALDRRGSEAPPLSRSSPARLIRRNSGFRGVSESSDETTPPGSPSSIRQRIKNMLTRSSSFGRPREEEQVETRSRRSSRAYDIPALHNVPADKDDFWAPADE